MKTNTSVWIALLVLSVSSFSIGGVAGKGTAAAFLLAAAGVKAGMVGWQFMDLRSAHRAWPAAMFALLLGMLGLLAVLA